MTATSNAADAFFGTVTLSDLGLIRASGSDAASFLHGQLTQDIETLAEGEARLAGYCSAKGRLLASFIVWRSGPEEILLACSADVLPATLKRLSMFVLRTKCKLTDASAELQLWGLAGPPATQWLGSAAPSSPWRTASAGAGHAVRLSDVNGLGRYLWCAPRGLPAPELPVLAEQAWAWLEVHSGIARITSGTTERFVPQMVNFELVAGVNFRKGCYPGQEIVARSQYRGTIKRRSFL
ncbi:MAG TPA: folate-binding protein, partial [Burkholderiaceae bacterium]|nr:folate-binding protein [Burkholderiaceae bacterium]